MERDLECLQLFFLQPFAHFAQRIASAVEIHAFRATTCRGGQFLGGGVEAQQSLDGFVWCFQTEEDLVGLLLITETRGIEWLDEVQIEIPLWLSGRPVVRRAKEQIANPFDATLLPLDLVLPNLVSRHVAGLVRALHELANGAVVSTIKRILRKSLGPLLDLRVVVDVLFQVEIVLLGVWRLGDELTVYRLEGLSKRGLDRGE